MIAGSWVYERLVITSNGAFWAKKICIMTKEELIDKLNGLCSDPEENHIEADELLLEFINDEDVKEAFQSIYKWYA